jgi:hypothetical protein
MTVWLMKITVTQCRSPREAAKKEKAKAPTADDDDLDALLMEFSTQVGQHLAANTNQETVRQLFWMPFLRFLRGKNLRF